MNITEDICHLLGIELDQEFSTMDNPQATYKITKEGLFQNVNGEWKRNRYVLQALITGEYIIKGLEYIPNDGEVYYYYNISNLCVDSTVYTGDNFDLYNLYCNNCFKSFEQALRSEPVMIHQIREKVL